METTEEQKHSTRPAPALPPVTMIVVAEGARARLAIRRSLPHCIFHFASTVEEAEALARTGIANGFYVF